MKTYALIVDNYVSQLVLPYVNPDGVEVPIEERFTPDMVAMMVDITDMEPQPQPNWTYDGTTFSAPAPYQPSPAEILAQNQANQTNLLAQASQAMTPVFLALQLDATDAITVKAKSWRDYYQALEAVDLTVAEPAWPATPT